MKTNLEEIREKVKKYDYSLCIWTDRTDFLKDKSLPDEDKLLEIRCFNENGEFHAFRSTVDKDEFISREITDAESCENSFDEEHYLDIDTTKAKEDGKVFATGGGSYYLPVEDAEKIIVKYYYTFDDNGIARKTDWRIVGFKAKEGK